MEHIGNIFKKIRISKRMTQKQMSKLFGSSYDKVERGENDVTISKLNDFASKLGMSLIDVITFPDIYEKKEFNSIYKQELNIKKELNSEEEKEGKKAKPYTALDEKVNLMKEKEPFYMMVQVDYLKNMLAEKERIIKSKEETIETLRNSINK